MSGLWIPGISAGPQEDFVARIHRRIEAFAREAGVEQPVVAVELVDGARFELDAIAAEPGYGFVTLRPHPDADEDLPGEVIVPVGSIRRIELARAAEEPPRLGFSIPAG